MQVIECIGGPFDGVLVEYGRFTSDPALALAAWILAEGRPGDFEGHGYVLCPLVPVYGGNYMPDLQRRKALYVWRERSP